jgi:hypothetical protein
VTRRAIGPLLSAVLLALVAAYIVAATALALAVGPGEVPW